MAHFVLFLIVTIFINEGYSRKLNKEKYEPSKIIGGNNVTIEDFPYQAYLFITQFGNKHVQCGGSILNPYFILTAAHCFLKARYAQARIGSAEATSGGTVYRSAYLRMHLKYNTVTKDYDIAVMRTLQKMNLDGVTTKAITLVERKTLIPSGSAVTVSGWGRIAPEGPLSPVLKAVELVTISNEECNEKLGGISARQLCAGLKDGSEDFCKGDSGGPAVMSNSKLQVGIVSASYGCAKPDSPGILVNVTDLIDWIYINTGSKNKDTVI